MRTAIWTRRTLKVPYNCVCKEVSTINIIILLVWLRDVLPQRCSWVWHIVSYRCLINARNFPLRLHIFQIVSKMHFTGVSSDKYMQIEDDWHTFCISATTLGNMQIWRRWKSGENVVKGEPRLLAIRLGNVDGLENVNPDAYEMVRAALMVDGMFR